MLEASMAVGHITTIKNGVSNTSIILYGSNTINRMAAWGSPPIFPIGNYPLLDVQIGILNKFFPHNQIVLASSDQDVFKIADRKTTIIDSLFGEAYDCIMGIRASIHHNYLLCRQNTIPINLLNCRKKSSLFVGQNVHPLSIQNNRLSLEQSNEYWQHTLFIHESDREYFLVDPNKYKNRLAFELINDAIDNGFQPEIVTTNHITIFNSQDLRNINENFNIK